MIGFIPDEISMVLELLSAVLNLGNIQFAPGREVGGETEGCKIRDDQRECL